MGDLEILSKQTDVVSLRRRVGMVFQKPNPFPKSIFDNVAFGPRLHFKIGKQDLAELVEWSCEKLPFGTKSKIDSTSQLWDSPVDNNSDSVSLVQSRQDPKFCCCLLYTSPSPRD